METIKFELCSFHEFYKKVILHFIKGDASYIQFNSECDIIFLHSVLKDLGFDNISNMTDVLYTPQILSYVVPDTEGDLIYIYFNPLSFTIGLIKDIALLDRLHKVGAKNLIDLEINYRHEIVNIVNSIKDECTWQEVGSYADFNPFFIKLNEDDLNALQNKDDASEMQVGIEFHNGQATFATLPQTLSGD